VVWFVVVETHGSGGGSGGGAGRLTVDVSLDGRSIPAKIEPETDNRFHVSFVPIGSGIYTVRVYYAGVEVTGIDYLLCLTIRLLGLMSAERCVRIKLHFVYW